MSKAPTFTSVERGYNNLFSRMVIRPQRLAGAIVTAQRLLSNRSRYEAIAKQVGCPWWLVAVIHELEGGGNFSRHLHNGDPLSRRTVHVPAGRPTSGNPPFTFEYSAVDALRGHGVHLIRDWSTARALYFLEGFNGWAYFGKINTPYLWSFSTHYKSGKITRDHGPIEMGTVSQQCGAAVLIRCIFDLTSDPAPKGDTMQELKDYIRIYNQFVPQLVQATETRLDDLVVEFISEVLNNEATKNGLPRQNSTVENVLAGLKALDITPRIDVLSKAESSIRPFLPVETQPVAEAKPTMASAETPSAPVATTPIDTLLGGSRLVGYKTIIGIALLVALKIVVAAGVAPWLPATSIELLLDGWIGAAVVAKVDRFLALLGK